MLSLIFHAWERRLADVAKDRVVRPFDWGLDWLPDVGRNFRLRAEPSGGLAGALAEAVSCADDAENLVANYVASVLADTDAWFTPEPTSAYSVTPGPGDGSSWVRFPSGLETPHPENNTVVARYFQGRPGRGPRPRRAVVVLPQWNSDAGGHIGLCRLLARFGISALRLSLPYHDARMPPELSRADYIVSSNVVRTLEVCRQAVMDARRAVWWLAESGYDRIGILGTSLGSCLSMLTTCHEPLLRAQALNHVSPYFGDVVWRGLSTRHVRTGLDGHLTAERLRELWMPISPQQYLRRLSGLDKRTLLVYAKYDLTFPVDLSRQLVADFGAHGIPHEVAVLPCGHYSTGSAPFKYLDGYVLTRFLHANL